jgi:hypothetical protein
MLEIIMSKIGGHTGYAFIAAFFGFMIFFYGGLAILSGAQGPEDLPWVFFGFVLMTIFSTVQWLSWRRLDNSLSKKPKELERVRLRRRFFLFCLLGGISLITAFGRPFIGPLMILPLTISGLAFTVAINTVRTLFERAREADDAAQAQFLDSEESNGGPVEI